MTANDDLQRRLTNYYRDEPPMRAPDWVLQSALSTIETTQQRGVAALRRYPRMPTSMKLAAAAVAVLAVGGFALWQLAPKPLPPGASPGIPSPAPTATRQPTAAPPTEPGAYVPGDLSETFTSDVHGITISYPAGWIVREATEPWTTDDEPTFTDPTADNIYDARLTDHMTLSLASQPLGDRSLEAWSAEKLDGCTRTEPVVVDGAAGLMGVGCGYQVVVSSGGRGYLIMLRKSDDDAELLAFDATDWFIGVLATVQLEPEQAVDAP